MKPYVRAACLATVCCLVSVACWNQQPPSAGSDTEDAIDTLTLDSMLASADTLLLDKETEHTPLPASVDEFFGDFIFNFDQSNRLQRSRIRYPLPVTEADGTRRLVNRQDWQHHYLFLQQEFCTVFWAAESQMEQAEDTSLTEADVEQIYLHSQQIHRYHFERDSLSHQWFLTEERIVPFEQSELNHFLRFYSQFANDSIFQRQHVASHIRYTYYDEENDYQTIQGTINPDQWFEFQPEMPQSVLTHINYGQNLHTPKRMLLQMRGINNGLENLFTFVRDGEHWRLTAFEN